MKIIFYFLSIIFVFSSTIGMQQSIPAAMLEWKPLNEYHITFFPLNSEFPEKRFIEKNAKILDDFEKEYSISFPLQFPLLTLDILTPTKIFSGFVLNTSFANTELNYEQFKKLFTENPPSPEKGKHWYLVFKLGNYAWFDAIRMECISLNLEGFKAAYTKEFFANPRRATNYLPHITIAEITAIHNEEIFLSTLEDINNTLRKSPQITTYIRKKDIIFKRATAEHPRQNVMLEIRNISIIQRVDMIKNWFKQLLNAKEREKEQAQNILVLKVMLQKLIEKLSQFYIQLQTQ